MNQVSIVVSNQKVGMVQNMLTRRGYRTVLVRDTRNDVNTIKTWGRYNQVEEICKYHALSVRES